MKLDQVGNDLIAGARYIERHGFPPDDPHPLRAVSLALQNTPAECERWSCDLWVYGGRDRYNAAADRLHDACGLDNMDLSPEEAIDSLVAAAYWEIP